MVDEQPIDIHQYSRALRAAAPRIAVFSLIAAAAAIVFSVTHHSSSTYAASTTILAGDTLGTAPAVDSTTAARRLATVNLLMRTTKVLSYAANRLDGITADQLRAVVRSSIDPNANVITITASGPTQAAATARADGVANALITIERQIEQQASTDARRSALAELARLREHGADALTIRAVQSQLALQAAGALGSVGGFQILQAAEPVHSSAAPVWLSSGVVVFFAAALLGMLVVLAREQVSPRLSATDDLGRFFEIPVLCSISSTRVLTNRRDLARLPPAVRDAFYVLASATRREAASHGKIVLVTSALRGKESTAVAANLGRALSTIDARVLLVSADLGSPRLHEWLDAPRAPGLADVFDALFLQADGRTGDRVRADGRIPRRDPPLELGHVPNARRDADWDGRKRSQGDDVRRRTPAPLHAAPAAAVRRRHRGRAAGRRECRISATCDARRRDTRRGAGRSAAHEPVPRAARGIECLR